MHFTGTLYAGDRAVAWDVLGAYSGSKGHLSGFFVLSVGQDVPVGGCYTLLTEGGQAQSILVLHSVGEAHQAKLVQFVSAKAMIAAAQGTKAVGANAVASPRQEHR